MIYNLSIILNLHREGDLLVATLSNLKNIVRYTGRYKNWEAVEIIAILDCADDKTYKIVVEHQELFAKIEQVNFGDLALSRFHGVGIARNNFLLFADGDDFSSHNMLVALYSEFRRHYSKINKPLQYVSYDEHIAVFPELLVNFPRMVFQKHVDSNEYINKNMQFFHCYNSRMSCHKSLIASDIYKPNNSSYGYEDWHVNNQLLSLGVKFRVAKNVILYYRRKDDSRSLAYNQVMNMCCVRNSSLYNQLQEVLHGHKISVISKIFNKLEQLKFLGKFFRKVFKKFHKIREIYTYNHLLKTSKRFLSSYNELNISAPSEEKVHDMRHFVGCLSNESLAYKAIRHFLEDKTILFIVPWVKVGGADLVITQYVRALSSIGHNVGVILTVEAGERIGRVRTDHLVLNSLDRWGNINESNKLHIILKAIINTESLKIIHVVNSDLGYRLIKYYSQVLKEYNKKIISSVFTLEIDLRKQKYLGYPIMYPEIMRHSDVVLGDNDYWYKYYKQLNNKQEFPYVKLYTPVDGKSVYSFQRIANKKILWASRICSQKLFGILAEIIKCMPDFTFVVYGDKPDNDEIQEIFLQIIKLPNVQFRGTYQAVEDININEFDLFLYTSLFDGVPNIVLEMAKLGIPVVATSVCGVKEILGSGYPLLINDVLNPLAYVEKINEFYTPSMRAQVQRYIPFVQEFIAKMHNFEKFSFDYIEAICKQ